MRRVFGVVLSMLVLAAGPLWALRTARGPVTLEGRRSDPGEPFAITLTTRGAFGRDVRTFHAAKAEVVVSPPVEHQRGFAQLSLTGEEGWQPVLNVPLATGPAGPVRVPESLAAWAQQFNDAADHGALEVQLEFPADPGFTFLSWAAGGLALLGLAVGLGLRRPRPS